MFAVVCLNVDKLLHICENVYKENIQNGQRRSLLILNVRKKENSFYKQNLFVNVKSVLFVKDKKTLFTFL